MLTTLIAPVQYALPRIVRPAPVKEGSTFYVVTGILGVAMAVLCAIAVMSAIIVLKNTP